MEICIYLKHVFATVRVGVYRRISSSSEQVDSFNYWLLNKNAVYKQATSFQATSLLKNSCTG
jgi:hypothetical protein